VRSANILYPLEVAFTSKPHQGVAMSTPFLGEIKIFAFPFAPKSWALCNGQLLSIQQNTALFSILGTTYGGNGVQTFALPDFRGRTPIHFGGSFTIGERGGEENHTLITSEMPAHNHNANITASSGTVDPTGAMYLNPAVYALYGPSANLNSFPSDTVTMTGGGQPHTNLQPLLVLNFCIALAGIFPSRN
jgi:microcystin-dependent protein